MLHLRYDTPPEYGHVVMEDFDGFLQDHAANERKVSNSAMQLAVQHWSRPELVEAMIEIADEEFRHFRQVYELLRRRGKTLGQPMPDAYVTGLRKLVRRNPVQDYLLDRLVVFAIIEARGCERFDLVAQALPPGELKDFYDDLVRSESRHHATYLRLARRYFDEEAVAQRVDEILTAEAELVKGLPLRAALH